MQMKQPRASRLKSFVVGLCALTVLLALVGGLAFVTGRAHPEGGAAYKTIGAVMVVAAIAVLGATVEWWAKWFFAVCFLMVVKAFFALIFGYTISQPRLTVDRTLAASMLVLLLAMLFLSYRYLLHPPRSTMESVGLVSAVVGLSAGILTEPNVWPLIGAVLLLGIPWLVRAWGAARSECMAEAANTATISAARPQPQLKPGCT